MPLLFVLFTALPFLEIYLLLRIGQRLGLGGTLALVVVTGLLGAFLAKREGLKALRQWRQAIAEMRLPEEGLASGVLILAGGILLLTPGVITDVMGLACLFPPTRRLLAGVLRQQFVARLAQAGHLRGATARPDATFGTNGRPDQVIDVEAHPVGEPGPRNKTPPAV